MHGMVVKRRSSSLELDWTQDHGGGELYCNWNQEILSRIPLFEFPSVTIPGWIPGFGGKKIGGFEVVNPLFFTSNCGNAANGSDDQAFNHDKPMTRVKMPTWICIEEHARHLLIGGLE